MTEELRKALAALRFNSAETPDEVWNTSPSHVDGLHVVAEYRIRNGIADAAASTGPSPIGLVLQGQKGIGKTHLLGWARRAVQREGGYFFLVELTKGDEFWADVASAMRSELRQVNEDGELQIIALLRRLCVRANVPEAVRRSLLNRTALTAESLRELVRYLLKVDERVVAEGADTIRALALYASEHFEVGRSFLEGTAEATHARRWGIPAKQQDPRILVRDISRVLALTGPCVVAIDQLDTLVSKGQHAIEAGEPSPALKLEVASIADGLMQLRQTTRRTLSIVACLPNSWSLLEDNASDSVEDRFTRTPVLKLIGDPEFGRALVAKWLSTVYEREGFTPPHPTWPVSPAAFGDSWTSYTPRELLKVIHAHAEACVFGEVRELRSFDEKPSELPVRVAGPPPDYLREYDEKFAKLRAEATISAGDLKLTTEDDVMPGLLLAAVQAWITEVGNDAMEWKPDPAHGGDSLHVSLRRTVDEEQDIQELWGFRFIASAHGTTVLRRMRNARDAAQMRPGVNNRHLVLLQNGNRGWAGAKTRHEAAELEGAGGRRVKITDDDLRTFSALKEMLADQTHQLMAWMVSRKPVSTTTFLREILPEQGSGAATRRETRPPPVETALKTVVETAGPEAEPAWPTAEPEPVVAVERTEQIQSAEEIVLDSVRIELESLRKHVMIFAGSGSGKTVLLRRIVEECALRGVSAIVLDPNNDLARMGDAWPERPVGWGEGDGERAKEYLANTEVVVWTPGRAGGRPLSFQPLPDFDSVREDVDEFQAAVEAAVARLVPHAGLTGASKAAQRGKAVLREALTYYARRGNRDLEGFVETLAELPEGVSQLNTGTATAADLAETLRAAMVNDPLLGGSGTPTDPELLLTPSEGKRARVSVISFVGLPAEEQRQGFVSQLQLEVFAWVKRNPATDRPLGGLIVMDEAQTIAPSGNLTASTQSTILLASQARKYGLGLILATQAPKGVHNQVVGNATTQFFGRLNSPAQIAAATEMARAKGSGVADISRLERGQFYATGEKFGFRKIRTPLCLSHHPPSPLRLEEVLDRARD
ncbi:ATP-binding protein [Kutzneria sp. 744]|uniref:ATP-binding protein n=1 Tax=Kutzneria sp. (strain 744) TaxID=345341 RepID=UPI0003EEC9FC|nr:ATP-binding protein [Kutzneria sp. 744]EWM13512.1 ATPase [Kutzneria sp. 744]